MLISDFENSQCQTFQITPLAELFVPAEAFFTIKVRCGFIPMCFITLNFFYRGKGVLCQMLWNRVYAHLKFVSQNKFLCYGCRSTAFFPTMSFSNANTNLKHQIKHSKWPKTMHIWFDFIIYCGP